MHLAPKYICSCNSHYNGSPSCYLLVVTHPLSPHAWPPATTNMFFIFRVSSFWEYYLNGLIQYVTSWDWLFFTQHHNLRDPSMLSPVPRAHSLRSLLVFHSMDAVQFVCPFTHWRIFEWFLFLAIWPLFSLTGTWAWMGRPPKNIPKEHTVTLDERVLLDRCPHQVSWAILYKSLQEELLLCIRGRKAMLLFKL